MSRAQTAQQANRDANGRYAERTLDEADVDLGLSGDEERRLAEARARYGDCVRVHEVPLPASVTAVTDALREASMNPLLVGGSVRDSFDGAPPKDLDFEVYGGSPSDIERVASRFGSVDAVGRSFGVLVVRLRTGEDLDLSVPRRDNKTGAGHKDFTVDLDPDMTIVEAAERRDFTINAMLYDDRLGVLIDPHGGEADLKAGVLRHISPAFAEDPLRVMRGMRFASRFGFPTAPETTEFCRSLRDQAVTLPDERVRGEWAHWANRSSRPSAGLEFLAATGWDAEHPGLEAVNDAVTRSEVDATHLLLREQQAYAGRFDNRVVLAAVLVRRMRPVDARAFLRRTVSGSAEQRRALMLGHDERPVPRTATEAREQARLGATIRERCLLVAGQGYGDRAAEALHRAVQAGVADGPERDLLDGRDILDAYRHQHAKAGPWTGRVIEAARAAQAEGAFRDRTAALAWLRARAGS